MVYYILLNINYLGNLMCVLKILFIILFIIFLLFISCKHYFRYYIHRYFRRNDHITYDTFIKCIQSVSPNNYFMNYGLWKHNTTSIKEANENLCQFIFDKGKLSDYNGSVLDVGCGYGTQDIFWHNKRSLSSLHKMKITAIDISETQIEYANKIRRSLGISKSSIKFKVGDAAHLLDVFPTKQFNRIISLESAFHYKNRPEFFHNVHTLLKENGLFIITDIVIKEDSKHSALMNAFIKLSQAFLAIPTQNIITSTEWKQNLRDNGLTINECYDVTDITFNPYYEHFISPYIIKHNMPSIITMIANPILKYIQPFSYVIAVCSKN